MKVTRRRNTTPLCPYQKQPLKTLKKHRLIKSDGRFGESPAFGLNCTVMGEGGEVTVGEQACGVKGVVRRVDWRDVSAL